MPAQGSEPSFRREWRGALADIARLARERTAEQRLGVVTVAVAAEALLYRLTPEAAWEVRREISRRIQGCLRASDRLYAVDSWEWLVVLPQIADAALLELAMWRLQCACEEARHACGGASFELAVLCGAASLAADGADANYLVQSARIARLAGERSGGRRAVYDFSMEPDASGMQSLEADLPAALGGESGLQLFLQPQVKAEGGACVGAESLLRWQRQNGEWVPPQHIMAVVERIGLRRGFNRWLFQQAIRTHKRLREAGIDLVLALNLTARDLTDPEIPDLLGQTLATWDVAPEALMLEITETAAVRETDEVADVLHRLRLLGLRLSIDDFGTAYSGMSYLQRLPVQEVKIDRVFVRNALRYKEQTIIASIVGLAHELGMTVVAEGVDSEEIRQAVSALGCDVLQGYLFSPAMPVAEFVRWHPEHLARRPP